MADGGWHFFWRKRFRFVDIPYYEFSRNSLCLLSLRSAIIHEKWWVRAGTSRAAEI